MSDPGRFGPLATYLVEVAMVLDPAGHLVDATPNAAAAFGWAEPLATGHWVIEVVHPDDRGRVIRRFSDFPAGVTRRVDARLRMPDDSWRWHELVVSAPADDREVGGLVVAVHDIGDRKQLEHELQRSEAYIKSLVQHVSDAILVLDAMVRIRFASPSAEPLTGRKPSELIGRNVLGLIHPEDRDAVADHFLETAHTTGQTAYLDFRLRDADGVERHVEAAATNLLDHPATNGIVVNIRDLGDRDRSRLNTELSERRFRKLIANISDTITLVDAEGRVMMVTGAAREILGFPGEYWSGQNVLDIVHPDDRERIDAFQQAALDHPGGEVGTQLRALHADGSWVDLDVTVVNLLDDPDVRGGVITSRNISSHKAIERALSDAHKQALDALAAKAEFVAEVGHEVRTPIHGIIGMAELLAEADMEPDARRLVDSIRRTGESLGLVINDLLDFSKMEAGRLELTDGVVSPHRLVADVVDMLRPQADEKRVPLIGSLDAQVPVFVRGDELRMRQVLVNLLGNAVKYTDDGTVRVTVTTVDRIEDACLLRFDVTDTGVGIPADEIERLFEPFTQASTTAEMRRPGTGLGLTITRQLVELIGGEITVSSEVGVGSTFSFTVPTSISGPAAPATPSVAPAPPSVLRGRVLVVEDSPVNQALIERQLIRLGCEPVVASSGKEALGLMDQLDVDLVLMDWQLPGMDGLETTRRWRAREQTARHRLPIVAMTASAVPSARQESLDAGMDDFLPKPVKLGALDELLHRFLPTVAPTVPSGSGASSGSEGPSGPFEAVTVDGRGAGSGSASGAGSGDAVALVDGSVLATLAEEMGDNAIAARVVETYLGEMDGRLEALRASASSSDHETLVRTAHTLGSTSRALGVLALADICAELEAALGDPDAAGEVSRLVERVVVAAAASAAVLRDQVQILLV